MATYDEQNILDRVVNQRAQRLGISRDTVLLSAKGEPLFLRAAENDPDLLARDLLYLEQLQYPGPDCIMPYELEVFDEVGYRNIVAEHLDHLRDCVFCSSLLSSAHPNSGRLREFLEGARLVVPAQLKPPKREVRSGDGGEGRSKIAS